MKYNEKVERCAPKLGRKNLANGLSCPTFVYMEDSEDGMWVHYVKYCENIAKQKYKRCLAMWLYLRECYWRCKNHNEQTRADWYNKWMNVFQKLAKKFKEGK